MNRAQRRRLRLRNLAQDECTLCGKPLDHLEITTIGHINGELHQVGACCTHAMTTCIGASIYFAAVAVLKPEGRA